MNSLCCDQFVRCFNNRGEEGISFLPKEMAGRIYFCLQVILTNDASIQRFQTGIQYCPFCGSSLELVVSNSQNHLKQMLDESKDYLL